MRIHKLDPHLINHIAAGEVIDRPVSVVKELIENSIDAEATRIEIKLTNGGIEEIQVSDNGTGIHSQDIPLVFERYATSKLSQLNDLFSIKQFGFRGEALFSIQTAANVMLKTCHRNQEIGTLVHTFQGQVELTEPIGYRKGTTFVISHLFDRFPTRKKQLNKQTELLSIQRIVEQFALSHPEIGFVLINNNAIVLNCFEQESLSERIESIWKLPSQHTQIINTQIAHGKLTAIISMPEFLVSTARHQLIIINSRIVMDSHIRKTVYASFKTFLRRNTHPQFFISLKLDPHILDVNVHPQKKVVRYLNQDLILSEVAQKINSAFHQALPNHIGYTASQLFGKAYSLGEKKDAYELGKLNISNVTQIHNTYLIATFSDGFLLLDQHAADERLWYNKLLTNSSLLKQISNELTQDCQDELADDLYQHSFEPNIDASIATIACHHAIRAGETLNENEMRSLIQDTLDGGINTLVCPHGRPTHLFISVSELKKVFRRT